MSHLDYTRPLRLEPDGRPVERQFARALARWVASHDGGPVLAALAARAAVAERQGDTALPPLDDDTLAALRDEAMVGDGRVRTPFVLDAAGRFYLWRNHQHELDVAAATRQRAAPDAAVQRRRSWQSG